MKYSSHSPWEVGLCFINEKWARHPDNVVEGRYIIIHNNKLNRQVPALQDLWPCFLRRAGCILGPAAETPWPQPSHFQDRGFRAAPWGCLCQKSQDPHKLVPISQTSRVPSLVCPIGQARASAVCTQGILLTRQVWEIIAYKPDSKPVLESWQEASETSEPLAQHRPSSLQSSAQPKWRVIDGHGVPRLTCKSLNRTQCS